jgi:hypothetical protein
MDHVLKAQLNHVIGYASAASLDFSGQVQVGSLATCWGRFEPYYREVPVGSDSIDERTRHMLILDETFPLPEATTRTTWFYLPGIPEQPRRPKNVQYCYDENANLYHIEITL